MVEITPTGTAAINAIVCKTMGQEIAFVSCRVYCITYITENVMAITNKGTLEAGRSAILYVIFSVQ